MVVKTAVLKELETLYAKSGNQLCVLYGRPDLEKELLLKTFLQNKKSLLLSCTVCVTGVSKTDDGGSVRGKTAGQAAKI